MIGARIRRAALLVAGLAAVLAALWFLAPREGVDRSATFDDAILGENPETWLEVGEQRFADIRPGAAKRILWAGAKGAKTPLSILYLHGFTASAEEIRPVPDEVARALGANLFYTRLAGHGRGPEAMGEVKAGDWIADLAEAMAISRRLGDRVLVIGTSMGGTLAAIAATDPELSRDIAGIVMISPAFELHPPAAILIDAPFPRLWAPLFLGRMQSTQPINADHAKFWTTAWPTAALFPLGALMREARAQDYTGAKMPLLVFTSPLDQVVNPAALTPVVTRWGGSVRIEERQMQAGDDPFAHVIAGDIFSPGQSEPVAAILIDWAKEL